MELNSLSNTIVTAVATGGISIATYYIKGRIKKKNDLKAEKERSIPLVQHPFFVRSEMLKNHIELTFTLQNKGKEIVFKDILYNLITAFQTVQAEFATRIDKQEIEDSVALYNEHMEALNKIIEKHHSYYKFNPSYTAEEQGVLDIVMKKFDLWNVNKISYLQEQFMSVCNSPFYNTIEVKAAVILDIYLGTSIDTLNDASRTLNSINGDLRGLKFRNIII